MISNKFKQFLQELKKIPNLMTLLRLILIPFLFYFAYTQQKYIFTALFLLAGITDVLDGYLARRLKQESQFGARFDSIADYAIVLSFIFWMYWFMPEFVITNLYLFVIIYVLFALSFIFEYFISKQKCGLHTIAEKISVLLAYSLFLLFVLYKPIGWLLKLISIFFILSFIQTIYKSYRDEKPNSMSLIQTIKSKFK
jgi:phosphatidylglycerophosphate synthase